MLKNRYRGRSKFSRSRSSDRRMDRQTDRVAQPASKNAIKSLCDGQTDKTTDRRNKLEVACRKCSLRQVTLRPTSVGAVEVDGGGELHEGDVVVELFAFVVSFVDMDLDDSVVFLGAITSLQVPFAGADLRKQELGLFIQSEANKIERLSDRQIIRKRDQQQKE